MIARNVERSNFTQPGEMRAIPPTAPPEIRAKIEAAREKRNKPAVEDPKPKSDQDPEMWDALKAAAAGIESNE